MRVQLRLPTPLGIQSLDLCPSTPAGTLLPEGWESLAFLRTRTSLVSLDTPISSLQSHPSFPVEIEVVPRLRGGKGGFGANLRSAGGRMSTGKSTNVDSCRDLQGRRLGTIKEAQKQADMIEELPELKAKAKAEERAKLEAIERRLGVSSGDAAADLAEVDVAEIARKRIKFDDNKFLEETREIKDSVRNAVGAALLKKKKKKAIGAEVKKVDKVVVAKKVAEKKADSVKMPPPAVKA